MKYFVNDTSQATLWQKNTFVLEVTFKQTVSKPIRFYEQNYFLCVLHKFLVLKTAHLKEETPCYVSYL